VVLLVAVASGCSGSSHASGGNAAPSPITGTRPSPTPNPVQPHAVVHHYLSGVQTVTGPASAAMVCASRDLNRVDTGKPIRLTVRLGQTTARLTATAATESQPEFKSVIAHPVVTIAEPRGDITRYPVTPTIFDRRVVLLDSFETSEGLADLCLVRFEPGQSPVAVLEPTPGCMQGCPTPQFFPGGHLPSRQIYTGQGGEYLDTDLGAPVDLTYDGRFYSEFDDLAASFSPLRVISARHGRLVNVTHYYPVHLRSDATALWHRYLTDERRYHDGLGALAAWVVDECSLGRATFAFATLNRLDAEGGLKDPGWTDNARFITKLRRFLIHTNYLQ
jgi:hypothetical protein